MNSRHYLLWLQPRRLCVLAMHTFTQLVRMKVFYFLMIFAVIAIASNFLDLPQFSGPEAVGIGQLQIIKGTCLGVMKLFAVVFSISATALLLPKDVEDRTLYTILAKPVPRLDYLIGKFIGVMLVVAAGLLLMDLLMAVVLQWRLHQFMSQEILAAQQRGESAAEVLGLQQALSAQGWNLALQGGVVAIFLQSSIVGACALLLSTFSTSTLFTTMVSMLIFFIGHFQADAAEYYRMTSGAGVSEVGLWISKAVMLVFPNFQLFNVVDAAIAGVSVSWLNLAGLAGLSASYVIVYLLLSWFVFADKEF